VNIPIKILGKYSRERMIHNNELSASELQTLGQNACILFYFNIAVLKIDYNKYHI
jgi:hypothetical protein